MEGEVLSLKELFDILKSKIILIVIITVVGTSLGFYYQKYTIKPTYLTSTKIFIGKEVDGEKGSVYESNDVTMYQNLMQTYAGLITSEDLIGRATAEIDTDLSVSDITRNITVQAGTEDQFLIVKLYTQKADAGVGVLEAITDEFINTSKELISNSVIRVINTPKIPKEPFNNEGKKILLISFLASLILGSALALVIEFLDFTIKRKEDIDQLLDTPILGLIPNWNSNKDLLYTKENVTINIDKNESLIKNDLYGLSENYSIKNIDRRGNRKRKYRTNFKNGKLINKNVK